MKLALAPLLLAIAPLAFAADPGGSVSAFYTSDSLDIDQPGFDEEDGEGFSAVAKYNGSNGFGVFGEYSTTRLENSREDLAIVRAGTSYTYSPFQALNLFVNVEALHVDAGQGDYGFGGHVGASYAFQDFVSAYAKGGVIRAGDLHGPEYSVGVTAPAKGKLRASLEYRVNSIKDDGSNVDADLSSVRIGFGIYF